MFCTGLFLQKGLERTKVVFGFFSYILAQNTLTAAQPGSQDITRLANSCWKGGSCACSGELSESSKSQGLLSAWRAGEGNLAFKTQLRLNSLGHSPPLVSAHVSSREGPERGAGGAACRPAAL